MVVASFYVVWVSGQVWHGVNQPIRIHQMCCSCGKRLDAKCPHRAHKDGRIHTKCLLSLAHKLTPATVVAITPTSGKRRRAHSDPGEI